MPSSKVCPMPSSADETVHEILTTSYIDGGIWAARVGVGVTRIYSTGRARLTRKSGTRFSVPTHTLRTHSNVLSRRPDAARAFPHRTARLAAWHALRCRLGLYRHLAFAFSAAGSGGSDSPRPQTV